MKIVHVNKNDLSGGAARAAYRLHKGLQRLGHSSVMVVESRQSDDASVVGFDKPGDCLNLVRRGMRQLRIDRSFGRYRRSRPSGYELFSDDRSSYAGALLPQLPLSDVINLHWIPGLVDYEAFFSGMRASVPIVWTLHDLNVLTGGCHYDLGCGRYNAGCGGCPQLGSVREEDLSRAVWARKERVFGALNPSRLNFVAPSRWLGREVERSPVLSRFPVCVIPYGLDLDEFRPRQREQMRELLGIAQDARVVLFVAEELENRRKGFSLLLESVGRCAKEVPNLCLLSLGQRKPDVSLGVPWIHVGSINNDLFLSMVYSVADVYAICSVQDNLPNTVLEAMACGVAVVGFGVGGIPDMVRDGVNGLIVRPGDGEALAEVLTELLGAPARCEKMGAEGRRIAIEEYSLERQARRYAELYAQLG